MEKVCPICNSLQKIETYCPHCQTPLSDGGILTDYFGPYSPYIESGQEQDYCIHLLYCGHCNYDERKAYRYITV